MNNLHLSYEAQNDLSDIKDYIAEDLENPQAAIATVSKITKTIRMLRDRALIGTPLSSIADVDAIIASLSAETIWFSTGRMGTTSTLTVFCMAVGTTCVFYLQIYSQTLSNNKHF